MAKISMAIYQIAEYRVKLAAVEKVKKAIDEFVEYVKTNEPGTEVYLAWQKKDDPTRFAHIFIFKDESSQTIHSQSEAVKHFESVYSPELTDGDVVFTDYEWVTGKR